MKHKVLALIEESGMHYISGQEISQKLGISRSAVWKHVQSLRKEGFVIDSVSSKGYHLSRGSTELNQTTLDTVIARSNFLNKAFFHESVDSTNQYAKSKAMDFPGASFIVVADTQSKGRGRRGRNWESLKNTGLWMSLLARPDINPEEAPKLTLIAAAAMAKAIDEVADCNVGIKWPNDLILNGKKIGGILTELSAEPGYINYVVIGIGINTKKREFDSELRDKATSLENELLDYKMDHLRILKVFVKHFEMYYNQFVKFSDIEAVLTINREKSVTLNRTVCVETGGETSIYNAIRLDEEGRLVVLDQAGTEKTIFFGEVSVRGINGYI